MSLKNDTKKAGGRQKNKGDLFDALNPNNMMSNAQRVLSSAVNVLEEEIAAGILAAKKIENKIIDVEHIREDPQDLMNRIRRDVHEAVDLLMDSVTAMTRQLGILSDAVLNKAETANSKDQDETLNKNVKKEAAIPVIKTSKPVTAGETAIMHISVSNDLHSEPVTVAFQKTDLTGPAKLKISEKAITIRPASVTLHHGEEKEITIQVKIPKTAKAGQYSALFVDANDSANRIVIHLEIN